MNGRELEKLAQQNENWSKTGFSTSNPVHEISHENEHSISRSENLTRIGMEKKVSKLEVLKKVPFPGEGKYFLEETCVLQHRGVICTDENYGFEPSEDCSFFVDIKYQENSEKWRIQIDPICEAVGNRTKIRSLDEWIKGKKNPKQRNYFGPYNRIRLKATKGKYAGEFFELDFSILLPPYNTSKPKNSSSKLLPKKHGEGNLSEQTICPFEDHDKLENIYGFCKYNCLYKRDMFYFNTRNLEINFISKKDNTATQSQQSIIKEMFKVTNSDLDKNIKEAKLLGELSNQDLIEKYGNMVDFILNIRFEIFIKQCIDKINLYNK